MSEPIVPPSLISKLGHNILEIRERALLTLISKIDNGVIFENDLAQSKDILTKLFEWFLFNPCPYEEMVLALIKRILLTDSGAKLINYYGPTTIKNELKQVKECLDQKFHLSIDEIYEIVDVFKYEEVVPPLISDTPLSYRSGQSCRTGVTNTSAKCFEGYVSKGSSIEPQVENHIEDMFTAKETFTVDRGSTQTLRLPVLDEIMPNYVFKWQPLIEADKHVLNSVEKSLRNQLKPSELLHSCEFIKDILLHDFPAEVFLQRPNMVLLLKASLYSSSSIRVSTSILKCFSHLTKALMIRINHFNDPSIRCLKTYKKQSLCSPLNLANYTELEDIEINEDFESLKNHEISTPKYCTTVLRSTLDYLLIKPQSLRDNPKKNISNLTNAVVLIEELICLLKRCLSDQIWNVQPHGIYYETLKDLNDCLISLGNLIENYRIHINTNVLNPKFRALHLCLLHHSMCLLKNFVPLDRSVNFLPKCLKNSLAMSLLDIPLAKLYPEIHNTILNYVGAFSGVNNSESLEKFHAVREVCESMTASLNFMRNESCFSRLIALAKKGILSLQFHKNVSFINMVIQACATKFSLHTNEIDAANMEDVLLSLLSHHMNEVVEYTYELCQKKVISAIGPMLNLTGTGVSSAQVVFLLRSKIIVEIAEYGICHENLHVKKYAEDIVIHLMKCKILVTDDIWDRVIEAMIPSFPILLVYASKMTPLGRTLINIVDPDIAKDLKLSTIDVIRSNSLLLFSNEEIVREEAFSRLCWLLASQENSKNLLPRLSNISDKTLPNVCQTLKKSFDVNKLRNTDRFYQPSSLQNVMELLNSPKVEPSIRRSALTQMAVMMEDYLLHEMFIERGGVESVITIMKNALIEEDYMNYADSVIPASDILKNICLYNTNTRYKLSHDLNVYQCILRGLFLFCTDERMKTDSSILLFLLLYSTCIQGTPSRSNMAIPKIVNQKINTPFICDIYGETSEHTSVDLTNFIVTDKSCLSSIQIHWNAEVYGGFQQLVELDNLEVPSDIKVIDQLQIQPKDLDQIRVSSVHFSIKECLEEMENGESLIESEDVLNSLIIYIYLYKLWKKQDDNSILNYSWEEHFAKYLRILPSSPEDASLLYGVLKLLRVLVPFYKASEKNCWITSILKDPTHYITDVISIENSSEEYFKPLSNQLVSLIKECVCQQQHVLDFHIESVEICKPISDWGGVIEMLIDNFKFQDPQQFYNLSYLNSLLSCLVYLTGTLGWTNRRRKRSPRETMKELISGLCSLVEAFHYGKGPTAAVSLMGLSITRNVLLILNHILAEMFHLSIKNWDLLFIDDISEQNKIYNFVVLWNTRDVVLKAAVLQFFAGLIKSARLARDIVSDLKKKRKCLWSMTLKIFLDNEEASVVRENAVLILANLLTHRGSTSNYPTLHSELTPFGYDEETNSNAIKYILEILDKNNFVKTLKILILCLYTTNISDSKKSEEVKVPSPKSSQHLYTYRSGSELTERSWDSNANRSNENMNIATPSLIKGTVIFLHNLIELTEQSFVDYLNEEGLIKLIFRSLSVPSVELKNTKQLSLYVEILEMNSEICVFLNRSVRCSPSCLGTILHTKDCLHMLISLLNLKMYYKHLPQLLYLRNKLWSEIFGAIGTFSECGCQIEDPKKAFEILAIILEAIYNCGPTNFIETICESIGCFGANELLNSVLLTLTIMLQIQCSLQINDRNKDMKNSIAMKHSMQNLLDTVKASKCINLEINNAFTNENILAENDFSKYKMGLLQKIYFGDTAERETLKSKRPVETDSTSTNKNFIMSGSEICKLLLNLYEIYDIKLGKESTQKQIVLAATSSLLCISVQAKYYALDTGFLQKIAGDLKELSIKLSLESINSFRRIGDKRRISPLLKDLDHITGLLTNFLVDNVSVKCEASCLGLADIVHKVWNWFSLHKSSSINVLKMLSTFTTNCPFACQSLSHTSPVAGSGPRKNASSVSLLHEIIAKISKEMDMLSKTHDILPLRLCFNILQNSSSVLECRICVTKSSLLQGMLKMHPAINKRQKPWEIVELIWLEYLQVFTIYPEGQMYLGKLPDVLDLIITLTQSTIIQNKQIALVVLQNLAFYSPNRTRLLTTANFINTLISKLEFGSDREKVTVVNTMWALAANNMKAKTVFKSAKLDLKLSDAIKKVQLLNDDCLSEEEVERMQYVMDILRQ